MRRKKRKLSPRKRINIHRFATILRKNMTESEYKLWKHLQQCMRKWNVIFEPQVVVGNRFIADFACESRMLIIEVDGSIHRLSRVKTKDKYRSAVLSKLGYTILRFSNQTIFTNCEYVLNRIRVHLERGE